MKEEETQPHEGARGSGPERSAHTRPRRGIPVGIALGVAAVLVLGAVLMWHAEAATNKVALSSSPKPVTAVRASGTTYRATRRYVGTLLPWIEASVGPQFVSAYVATVLVRPGATVKKGEILATLDCRNATAASQALASQAQAMDARQRAAAHEAARTRGLLDGGFVSPNEAEQKMAQSAAQAADLAAQEANLARSTLDVNDCILRAPFDGEISSRSVDPGAFVRPGVPLVSVVDRSTVRMTGDAPEDDFAVVAPGTPTTLDVIATKVKLTANITRRSPSADPGTRTVHFEIDVFDPDRRIPVDTTGEVTVGVGEPVPATRVPISAISASGTKATYFTVEGEVARAHTSETLGEIGGDMYFRPGDLAAESLVVTEGRALLANGNRVVAHIVADTPAPASEGAALLLPTVTAGPPSAAARVPSGAPP